MIKTVTVLLNFAFKWLRLVNETHTIRLVQAGKQANQLACTVDHTGKQKFLFICHKKGVLGKHPIHENNTYVCFH